MAEQSDLRTKFEIMPRPLIEDGIPDIGNLIEPVTSQRQDTSTIVTGMPIPSGDSSVPGDGNRLDRRVQPCLLNEHDVRLIRFEVKLLPLPPASPGSEKGTFVLDLPAACCRQQAAGLKRGRLF